MERKKHCGIFSAFLFCAQEKTGIGLAPRHRRTCDGTMIAVEVTATADDQHRLDDAHRVRVQPKTRVTSGGRSRGGCRVGATQLASAEYAPGQRVPDHPV